MRLAERATRFIDADARYHPSPREAMPSTALLALDLQRDFLADDARMPVARAQVAPLLEVSNSLIDAAAARAVPVVFIVNAFPRSQRLLNFLRRGAAVAGTPGAELDPRVRAAPGATFPKERGDAFTNPALDAYLRAQGITHLLVIGVFAPACVRATARGALGRGYRVTVVRDGVGAGSDRARARGLARMAKDGAEVESASRAFGPT